jgi:hypothetical protein
MAAGFLMTEERVMTDRDSGPPRTDAAIVARSEAALRHALDPDTERLRMMQVERERNRLACETLADLYPALNLGQWAEKDVTINQLAETVAEDLLACRAKVRRLEIQLDRFKGGE